MREMPGHVHAIRTASVSTSMEKSFSLSIDRKPVASFGLGDLRQNTAVTPPPVSTPCFAGQKLRAVSPTQSRIPSITPSRLHHMVAADTSGVRLPVTPPVRAAAGAAAAPRLKLVQRRRSRSRMSCHDSAHTAKVPLGGAQTRPRKFAHWHSVAQHGQYRQWARERSNRCRSCVHLLTNQHWTDIVKSST